MMDQSTTDNPDEVQQQRVAVTQQHYQQHNDQQQVATSILQLGGTSSSSNTFEIQEFPATYFEDTGAVVLDSGIAPFFDNMEGGQMIFKGILDHNGALVLDPAQFAALIGSVQVEHVGTQPSSSSQQQQPQSYIHSVQLPLTPLNQQNNNNKLDNHNKVSSAGCGMTASSSTEPLMIQNLSGINTPMIVGSSSSSSRHIIDNTTLSTSIPKLISSSTVVSSGGTSLILGNNNENSVKNHVIGGGGPLLTEIQNQQPEAPLAELVLLRESAMPEQPPLGKGPYRCTDCEKVFQKWHQFKRHKSEHLDSKKFQCPLCLMSFNHEANLKLHEMIHEAELSGCLQCKMCPAKFSRLASLKSHVRVHEKEENLVCVECGDEFATKARLDTHLEEHKTTKSLVHRCRLCGRTFTHAALLKDHSKEHSAVRNQLKLISSRRKRPAQQKVTAATTTDSSSSSAVDPSTTLSSTKSSRKENKKKLLCAVCAKRFAKPSQLSRHMRIHTGEKPYACKQCDKSFNQKNTLDSHILSMHEKLKPHTCHLCNCQFSQRGNLRAHVLKVHVHPGVGEQCFKCEDCSCIFKKLASLNTHIAKAHSRTRQEAADEAVNKKDSNNLLYTGLPPILPLPSSNLISNTTIHETLQPTEQPHSSSQVIFSSSAITTTLSNKGSIPTLVPVQQNTSSTTTTTPSFAEVTLIHEAEGQRTAYTVKVKRVGQVKFHMCPYNCSKSFKKPSDLIRHIRIHTLEKPFACKVCKKSFSVKSTLNIHMKIHSDRKDWECRDCHKRFTVLTSLRAHERLHTGAKPFPCMQCGKFFRTSSQRRVHMKAHTRNQEGLTGKRRLLRIGDTEPKVELPDPLKITPNGLVPVPNRAALSLVAQASDKQKDPKGVGRPYRCGMCPAGFKKSSHLKQHQRSHTNERPYKCFQCFRSFISSGVLKNHIKTHEGVRAFKCKQCQLSFSQNGSLTRHMVTHSDDRSFVCPYCSKAFKTSVSCRKHIKTHSSEFVALSENDQSRTTTRTISDQVGVQHQSPQNNNNRNFSTIHEEREEEENVYENANNNNFQTPAIIAHQTVQQTSIIPNNSLVPVENCRPTTILKTNQQKQDEDRNIIISQLDSSTLPINTVYKKLCVSQPLQYSSIPLQNTGAMDDVVNHITLSDAQAFENTIFTLQGSENLELHCPSISLLQNVQPQPIHLNHSSNTIYANQPPSHFIPNIPINPIAQTSTTNPSNNSIIEVLPSSKVIATVQTVIDDDDDGDEEEEDTDITDDGGINNKVMERMPPEQEIYSDMQTAASSEVEINMTEFVTTFSDLANGKINICEHCGRGFKKRSDLVRHARIHTGEKPFKCTVCTKSFRVKSTREAHMRTHQGGKTVSCHVCNRVYSSKSSLSVHLRLHTGSRPYKCDHCDRDFRTSGHRKAHISSHFKTSPTKGGTKSTRQLNQQMRASTNRNNNNNNTTIHIGGGIRQQTFVQNTTETLSVSQNQHHTTIYTQPGIHHHHNNNASLSVHHHQQDPNVQIIGSLQLPINETHQQVVHQNIQLGSIDLSSLQISEELLQSLGNVIFVTPHNTNHQIITTGDLSTLQTTEGGQGQGDKPLVQNQNQLSSIVTDLETLLPTGGGGEGNLIGFTSFEPQSHNNNNNSVLNINNNNSSPMLSSTSTTFTGNNNTAEGNGNPNNLNDTTQITAATPSTSVSNNNKQCPTCGRIYSKPSLLARHMTTHTGQKPFKCDICNCTFDQKNTLAIHKYTHGTERPFACTICPFKTVVKAALKKHLTRAHPDVKIEDMLQNQNNSKSS